jgi:hypothetical protein
MEASRVLEGEIVGWWATCASSASTRPSGAALLADGAEPVRPGQRARQDVAVRRAWGDGQEAIAAVDPALPVAKVASLDEIVGDALRRPRFTFVLMAAFALTAALLAGLGLFGVLSYSVAQRLPEMGLRLALGARPQDVGRLVLREGAGVAAVGA